MSAIRAVTWDAHGTLIVPHPDVGTVYAEIAGRFGIDAGAGSIRQAFPGAFVATRDRWRVPYGADEDDARRFWTTVIAATFAACGHAALPVGLADALFDEFALGSRWRVVPGAVAALAMVRERGLPMAVVSNFDGRLPRILAALGLGPFVTQVLSAGIGAAKPDPAPMAAAVRALGCPPQAILHLGDSPQEDGGMCAAAGCRWFPVDPGPGIDVAGLAAALDA